MGSFFGGGCDFLSGFVVLVVEEVEVLEVNFR